MELSKRTRDLLKTTKHPVSIIIGSGNSLTSLSILRCLGRRKLPVICVLFQRKSLCRFSKYCSAIEYFSKDKDLSQCKKILIEIGRRSKQKSIIFYENDEYALFIDKEKEVLSEWYYLILPPNNSMESMINKDSMIKAAMDAKIDVPGTYFSNDVSLRNIDDFDHFPCLMKPLYTQTSMPTKGVVINNRQSLHGEINNKRFRDGYVVQEIVNGGVESNWICAGYISNIYYYCFTYQKLRQLPKHFGLATVAVSKNNEEIKGIVKKYLTNIQYAGFFDIEFIRDVDDGKYKFIEINPRICSMNGLVDTSGLNLPYIAYCDLTGNKFSDRIEIKVDIIWISIIEDFITCIKYYFTEDKLILFSWLKHVVMGNSYAVLDLADPMPMVYKMYKHLTRLNYFRRL